MLARQEEEEIRSHEDEIAELEQHVKEPLYQTVLDTSLRSHFRALFTVAAILAMLVTIQSGISANRGYRLVATQDAVRELEQENERLQIEIDKLKSPQRIKTVAADKLGMEVPNKIYFAREQH